MCEQLNEEPDYNKIPPDFTDFPLEVQEAIITYGKLGDRVVADVGYMGKDYTSLPLHMEILKVRDKELFLETILRLDERMIKKSAEAMKRERDKLKSKH